MPAGPDISGKSGEQETIDEETRTRIAEAGAAAAQAQQQPIKAERRTLGITDIRAKMHAYMGT